MIVCDLMYPVAEVDVLNSRRASDEFRYKREKLAKVVSLRFCCSSKLYGVFQTKPRRGL